MKFQWIDIDGYRLRAPKGFLDSSLAKTGKCGPNNGSLVELVIPETILGLRVTPACKIHDYCYAIATDTEEKETADVEFFLNGYRVIKQKSNICLRFPRAVIMTWFMLAVLFGGKVEGD